MVGAVGLFLTALTANLWHQEALGICELIQLGIDQVSVVLCWCTHVHYVNHLHSDDSHHLGKLEHHLGKLEHHWGELEHHWGEAKQLITIAVAIEEVCICDLQPSFSHQRGR